MTCETEVITELGKKELITNIISYRHKIAVKHQQLQN